MTKQEFRNSILVIVAVTCICVLIDVTYDIIISCNYNKAVVLTQNSEFSKAEHIFLGIRDARYKDTESYIKFCEAGQNYNNGDISKAHIGFKNIEFKFADEGEKEAILNFKNKTAECYEIYWNRRFKEVTGREYKSELSDFEKYGNAVIGLNN